MTLRYWPVALVVAVVTLYVFMLFNQDIVYRPLACLPAGLTLLALQIRDFRKGEVWMKGGRVRRADNAGIFWWGHTVYLSTAVIVTLMPAVIPDSGV
jgi:hypothetical protein